MFEKFKYLFKNIGIFTISQFSSKILIFFLLPLYTNVLSTEQYGIYDLAISVIELLYPILTINIIDAVMRFLLDRHYKSLDVISIAFKYVLGSIMIATGITAVIYIFELVPSIVGFEVLVLLYFVFYVLHQFIVQVAKGIEKIRDIGIAGVIGTISLVLFNLLFLLVFEWQLYGFFIANILSQLIPTIYLLAKTKIWKYIHLHPDKKAQNDMIIYCLPLIVNTLAWWANSTVGKFIVTFFLGVSANGILSVGYKIPNMLSVLQGIFNQGWQISAIKEYNEEGDKNFFENTILLINSIMLVCASFIILLTKWLAILLFANDFYVAWQYVPLLVVAVVINTNSGIYGAILSAKKRSKAMAITSLVGIFVNIVIDFVLVHFLGLQGATIATLASSFTILILRQVVIGKSYRTKWDKYVYLCIGLITLQSCLKISLQTKLSILFEVLIVGAIFCLLAIPALKNIYRAFKTQKNKN